MLPLYLFLHPRQYQLLLLISQYYYLICSLIIRFMLRNLPYTDFDSYRLRNSFLQAAASLAFIYAYKKKGVILLGIFFVQNFKFYSPPPPRLTNLG